MEVLSKCAELLSSHLAALVPSNIQQPCCGAASKTCRRLRPAFHKAAPFSHSHNFNHGACFAHSQCYHLLH